MLDVLPAILMEDTMYADEWDAMLDGMFKTDIRSLCHLLLLKRSVDGGSKRVWDALEHSKYESLINETLRGMGK